MNNELNDILSDPNMSYDFGGINPECQFYDNLLKNYCVEILINLKVVNETLDEFIADSTKKQEEIQEIVRILLENLKQIVLRFEYIKINCS